MNLKHLIFGGLLPALAWYSWSGNLLAYVPEANQWATEFVGLISDTLARALNLEAGFSPQVGRYARFYYADQWAVGIADPCNGIAPIGTMLIFMFAFPGKLIFKLLAGLVASASIFALNGVRVLALAIQSIEHPESFDFSHHYFWTIFVYAVIIAYWYVFIQYFSLEALKKRI